MVCPSERASHGPPKAYRRGERRAHHLAARHGRAAAQLGAAVHLLFGRWTLRDRLIKRKAARDPRKLTEEIARELTDDLGLRQAARHTAPENTEKP
jgi:hypothetical protein